jgi:predicted DNA-binding transcriptional regulator AlpA
MDEAKISRTPRCSLNLEEVCRILGCRPSKLYEDVKAGRTPAPYRISTRAVRWDSDEIYDTLDTIKQQGREAWLADNKTTPPPINPKLRTSPSAVVATTCDTLAAGSYGEQP